MLWLEPWTSTGHAGRLRHSDTAAQEFRRDPRLEAAFLDGYGADPREPQAWRRIRVREAIGTAVWAHLVGDVAFEAQGHRMLAEVLD